MPKLKEIVFGSVDFDSAVTLRLQGKKVFELIIW